MTSAINRRALLLGGGASVGALLAGLGDADAWSVPATTSTAPKPTTFKTAPRLVADLRNLHRGSHVRFGVGVHDARTGRRFIYAWGGPYEMGSTIKVDILLAVLWRAHLARRSLTARERRLATVMIEKSDNAAANALWAANGSGPGMRRMWTALGITGMSLNAHNHWGLTRTTITARLAVLGVVADGVKALPRSSTIYEESLMRHVIASQRFGVGHVVRPTEWGAVKNGWLPRATESQRWIVNTSGIIGGSARDLRFAVFSHGHASMSAGVDFTNRAMKLTRDVLAV